MDAIAFISLINPGISLIFAAAFFLLWRARRERIDVAIIAGAFFVLTFGFLFQYFVVYDGIVTKLISNIAFLAACVGMLIGSLMRLGVKPPVIPAIAITAIGFLVFLWYLLVDNNVNGRIFAINYAYGAITLMMGAKMYKAPRAFHFVDKLLVAQTLLWGMTYFIRPALTVLVEGPLTNASDYHSTGRRCPSSRRCSC